MKNEMVCCVLAVEFLAQYFKEKNNEEEKKNLICSDGPRTILNQLYKKNSIRYLILFLCYCFIFLISSFIFVFLSIFII